MFIINYSVPCLSDGTITHLLHLVWKQWADATTCTVKRNELVEILARLKRPAKQIELAGEAFQREELKSSLQESRQIGLYLLWFDVWLDVKSVERRKEDRGEEIKEEREESFGHLLYKRREKRRAVQSRRIESPFGMCV